MKLRSKVNGALIDISEEGATQLIDAGIYDAVEEKKDAPKAPPKPAPKKSDKSTTVKPLTTEDVPMPPKQAA